MKLSLSANFRHLMLVVALHALKSILLKTFLCTFFKKIANWCKFNISSATNTFPIFLSIKAPIFVNTFTNCSGLCQHTEDNYSSFWSIFYFKSLWPFICSHSRYSWLQIIKIVLICEHVLCYRSGTRWTTDMYNTPF